MMTRTLTITKYAEVISLALLIVSLILLVVPLIQGAIITYTCINGELKSNTTCIFPQVVKINNYVIGNALVSINNGQPERLSNGSIMAREITLMPAVNYVRIINESQVTFNIYNPMSKWVNITLPGSCTLTINATVLGSGYVSITVLSDRRVIDYTPYTYSLFITTQADNNLDILIKPAVPLSCPCINTIVNILVNGTCIQRNNAIVTSIAYVESNNTVNNAHGVYALILILASLIMLATSLILSTRR
ncbi:hypothetical protein [Vulcanisaeta distributa]|uniref:Uncharacterized protein n=1 Tax=Vulcanisaeta distributa (strain DSM 14429 / JCM 11212 / NBRC 100878 / IC-017) TaxID=572478 RepID=E1QPI7_VULDI|nr:hypothetical protein [Vulcanisaeta distributa]ADN51475.1 hypothetical protein Vdis_2106 [Vulcanisaeta distributa DSM 14429]